LRRYLVEAVAHGIGRIKQAKGQEGLTAGG
jgi:hypothetical protein